MDNETKIVDLIVTGGGEGNIRSVFPVSSVTMVDDNGEEAVLFEAAETPSDFSVLLPIKRKHIVSLFSYNITDSAAPAPRIGETVEAE